METEYLEAVKSNDLEAIEILFNSTDPPDVNEVDEEGRTPLAIAIDYGYYG